MTQDIFFFIHFSDDVNGLDKYRCFLNKIKGENISRFFR
ncbi:hypothetical protein [Citrobacter freundii]|uniref:Uncharacterized protein n=1 Tax=Citrobacter freundii TaxID=546 RepID=A0A7G2IMD2_CITFR|nr:hypothetical protein [Citrobacter freundii]